MGISFHTIVYSTLLFTVIRGTIADINCPDVLVQTGSTQVIVCNIDQDISDFYWYKGQTSRSRPILSLVGGQKGGSEFGKGHFDIADNGSMIVSNVKLEHESYYTFVGYYESGDYDDLTFMLNVTIPPNPPCPVIEGCSHCTNCFIGHLNQSGTLKCTVSRARPLISLKWNITSQTGISFVKYQPVERRHEATDSWDTFVLAEYKLTETCGAHAVILCMAHGYENILASPFAALEISNDRCVDVVSTPDPTDVALSSTKFATLIAIPVILVVTIASIAVLLWLIWKKYRKRSTDQKFDPEEMPLLSMPKASDKGAPRIVPLLEENYKKHCYIKPLPWGEDIHINALYTNCQCTVTTWYGKTFFLPSDKLLEGGYIKNEKRVLFIGDVGYGKTTFTKQVVNNWIQNKEGKFLLIYILLKDVKSDTKLLDIIMNLLPDDKTVSVDEVRKTILQYGCLVLLDGLDELSMTEQDRTSAATGKDCCETVKDARDEGPISSLTLQQLLNGNIPLTDVNMKVWVTSREIDYAKRGFPTPYIKVKMNGFSEEQAEDYIKKTCRYFFPSVVDTKGEGLENSDSKLTDIRENTMLPESTVINKTAMGDMGGDDIQRDHDKIDKNNTRINGLGNRSKEETRGEDLKANESKLTDSKENSMLPESTVVEETGTNGDNTQEDHFDENNIGINGQGNGSKEETKSEAKGMETCKHEIHEEWERVAGNVKQFMENNEVLSSFEKTPLFFIMMVHILSGKHASAFSELKNVPMDNLTDLISTAFTCLKSRYVQKRNTVWSENIAHLEEKLGKIAFEHNVQLDVMEREFWVKAIGEENVKIALEMGLLQPSTNTVGDSKRIKHLAFSSFTGIGFYNEFFQAFTVANFLLKNQKRMADFYHSVQSTKEYETPRVLQFMCGLNTSVVESICDKLRSVRKYNNLIDCLSEGNDEKVFKTVVEKLKGDKLNIFYLDRSHHRNSLSTFCAKCKKLEVNLFLMAFHSDCTIQYLITLTLPELQHLHLVKVDLSESYFVRLIKWLSNQNINEAVRLLQCKIPEKISDENLQEVRKGKQVTIHRKKKMSSATVFYFDYTSGSWKVDIRKTGS